MLKRNVRSHLDLRLACRQQTSFIYCAYGCKKAKLEFMVGTAFQKKVWNELKKIPYGETRSYKEVALAIGHPQSARAVANACAKNPYAPIVPCHRVVRSDGNLGGYSAKGGIKKKAELLRIESQNVRKR